MNLEAQTHELKVGEYMTPNLITVQSNITFTDAATKMAGKEIGNLLVVENKNSVGILTEREILQYLSQWRGIPNRLLEYVRVQPFETVKPDTTILDAAKAMISKKSKVVGVVCISGESKKSIVLVEASSQLQINYDYHYSVIGEWRHIPALSPRMKQR
ncbi:MAG: CBS domain-containing protein [Candidatus Nitrosopolaris sp.]